MSHNSNRFKNEKSLMFRLLQMSAKVLHLNFSTKRANQTFKLIDSLNVIQISFSIHF